MVRLKFINTLKPTSNSKSSRRKQNTSRSHQVVHQGTKILILLFLGGCLIFFSSFFALNGHLSADEISHMDLHIRVDHPESRFYNILHFKDRLVHMNITSPGHVDKFVKPILQNIFGQKTRVEDHSAIKELENSIEIGGLLKSPTSSKCRYFLPTKCAVSPFVKYWDDYTDCFESPLRNSSGLHQSLEKRKYVVFQPDLGGWNNIRMGLEVVIMFAHVTGRILVMPPNAVLYLLHMNKKWDNNKQNMNDFIDFARLSAANGLEVISMEEFLTTVAKPGLLYKPLPNNDVNLIKKPLWEYLESACYGRLWVIGKTFISFNFTSHIDKDGTTKVTFGNATDTSSERYQRFAIGRKLVMYDEEFHSHRAIFFPGHEDNRLLTHFYSYLYFADKAVENAAKRFVRDRLRYLDEVYCAAGKVVERLRKLTTSEGGDGVSYVAYHIRRGDFQQKHTRLSAERILELSYNLTDRKSERVLYISTDEGNRTFFEPFMREFKAVKFLSDFLTDPNLGLSEMNQNHLGMVEQLICATAHTFVGTPLSTFTSYITRLRGYLDRNIVSSPQALGAGGGDNSIVSINRTGLYSRTYYYMKAQMFQLTEKPHLHLPFWVREFKAAFEGIDEF